MKTNVLLAASAVLVTPACCAVHKLKLNKIPLSEQLEHTSVAQHAQSLYKKYGGQKVMGSHSTSHKEEMFRDTSIHEDGSDHPVPVTNFLNAQCTKTGLLHQLYHDRTDKS